MFDYSPTRFLVFLDQVSLYTILAVVLIIAGGIIVASILRRMVLKVLIRFMQKELAELFSKTAYFFFIALSMIIAIGVLGVDLTGFILAGGIIGIILGFALKSITSNLVSGIFLLLERTIKPGELVEVDGIIGRVVEINLMSTKIIDLKGVLTRIPNEKVFQSLIKNYNGTVVRVLELVVGIAYREDILRAYNVIQKVIDEHPLVLVEPKPDIFVHKLGDSSVDIKIRAWVPSSMYYDVLKDLLWRIKEALRNEGIEIPFPQRDVWFRSPLEVKVKYIRK